MFVISLTIILIASIFLYGMAVGNYKIFPYQQVKYIKDIFFEASDDIGMLTKTKPTQHLFNSRYMGTGVVHLDKELAMPGLTLISSFFDKGIEIRLVTLDGKIVNRWPIKMFEIWENFDHVQPPEKRPTTDWHSTLNGAMLLPDGSVVFNLFGVIKLDRCGNLVWKVPKMAHHSIEPSNDGGFWVGGKNYIYSKSKHPPIQTPYEEDTILKISSDGSIEHEISILDILWKNKLLSILFSNNRAFHPNAELDVIHLNDIEELPIQLEHAFPMLKTGDLLVSLRQTNMIMIVDPNTELVKWHRVGPWIQQHDADYQDDGTITVFDNAYDGTEDGRLFGGSKIISVDPSSGNIETLFGMQNHERMYTASQGDHQIFQNGNILMAEAEAGRIIEVDNSGNIVWEYINRYSDDEVFRVADAIRYPLDYLNVENWSCNQ